MIQTNSRLMDDYSLDILVKSGTEQEYIDLYQSRGIVHDNLLYICDNGTIYFGDIRCSSGISYNDKPATGSEGVLYIDPDGTLSIWNGNEYTPINQSTEPVVDKIGELPEGYSTVSEYIGDIENTTVKEYVDNSVHILSENLESIANKIGEIPDSSESTNVIDYIHEYVGNTVGDFDSSAEEIVNNVIADKIGNIPDNQTLQEYTNLTVAKTIQNRLGNIPQGTTIQEYIDKQIVAEQIDEEMLKQLVSEAVDSRVETILNTTLGTFPEGTTVRQYIDSTDNVIQFDPERATNTANNKSQKAIFF